MPILFVPIIMICSGALARDECNAGNARSVIYGEKAKNEVTCGFYAQALAASPYAGVTMGAGEWMKVGCRRMGGDMKTSLDGLVLIRQREGVRAKAYQDTRGVWTIGVGHTGPDVHSGLVWTEGQVDTALEHDLQWAENEVNAHVTVPLAQNQFDALVSFTFNVGASGFDNSSFLRDFNAAVTRAAADLLLWEKPPELKGRRESEYRQFLGKEVLVA